jgi:hypothetical protein
MGVPGPGPFHYRALKGALSRTGFPDLVSSTIATCSPYDPPTPRQPATGRYAAAISLISKVPFCWRARHIGPITAAVSRRILDFRGATRDLGIRHRNLLIQRMEDFDQGIENQTHNMRPRARIVFGLRN